VVGGDGFGSSGAPLTGSERELAGDEPAGPAAPRAAAAFFDLDRTLMAGSSGIFFAKAAFQTGMISRRRLARDVYENVRFRLRGSTDERADAVRIRVGEMISGVPVRDLERLSPRVLAGVLPRLYPEMLAKAWSHQDEGMRVYIVTAASQEMADLLARVLAFDGGIGSRSEVIDGFYTGRAAGPFNYREGKRAALQALAEQEGIDLACSYAYSDSESDLPMLRSVGNPVAVNPDAELARVAAVEGWEVVRLDLLGRRLKLLGALTVGGATAALAAGAVGAAGIEFAREMPAAAGRRGRGGRRSGRLRGGRLRGRS
jgi:HAD superfamily hydrolase (TIGR01490 family)